MKVLRLFRPAGEVDVYLATMQDRFSVLRQASALQAERMHHQQRIGQIDEQLARIATEVHQAIEAIKSDAAPGQGGAA